MPNSRRTQYDDYIESPRQTIRTSGDTQTYSSRSGVLFGEEVCRSSPLPRSPPPRSSFSCTINIYFKDDEELSQSRRRYTGETRVPLSSRSRTHTRTTASYTEREGGRTRNTYCTEERVPSSRSASQQSGRASQGEYYDYTRTYRYDEPEPYRYAEPDYKYEDPDTYHYAEPEPEHRRRRATYGSGASSRQTYYAEESQPCPCCYDSPPEPTFSRPRRSHTSFSSSFSSSSSTPRISRTSRTPPSYSSSRSSRPSASSQDSEPVGVKPRNDFYAVLNLSRDATSAEVKKAYRTLSLRWHPDRCSDEDRDMATEKMAEINQAHDVLGDNEKRAYYDQYGLLPAGM